MGAKQVVKFCIYAILWIAFIIILIQAFENLLSGNTGRVSWDKHEQIKMPSMTICPSPWAQNISINSNEALDSLKEIPMNVSVTLKGIK